MKRDGHQSSPGGEQNDGLLQKFFQSRQFLIDLNAQSLKYPRGRVDATLGMTLDLLDEFRQLGGGPKLGSFPTLNNGRGNPSGCFFFSIAPQDFGQPLLRKLVDKIRGSALLVLVHAHVERSLQLKAKTSLWRIQLVGRDPQVDKAPVQTLNPQVREDDGQIFEVFVKRLKNLIPRTQTLSCSLQGLFVTVKGNQTAAAFKLSKDLFGMSSQSHSAIHIDPPLPDLQEFQNLAEQDRNMFHGRINHV